ncbi:MAG TPA: 1-deoxy-D-xylulose-5-phosphate synthase [Clostridiales bacterium]|jgi:1-deoxy-D-xylulose-5-phosphate synthase|nr:1-deoxy-D-xylulose-5-phosphate synthase [Clostridiales bacterium]
MNKKTLMDYQFPQDLKNMDERDLELLTYEIRDFLIEKVSKNGGHLASNLGVVELTIALHKVFESPKDKIIWDVGHQSYVHKILTGRASCFDGLRCLNGISGFPKREESPHDMFDTGHSSNSISAAMGYAAARDLNGEDYSVISIIGDGALTGGMAYEALNNAGSLESKIIVVLNDNEMSISKNIGGISHHLAKLRSSRTYLDFKKQLKKTLKGIPGVGEGLYNGFEHIRDSLKYAIVPGAIFEQLGFKYFGPVDGHNIKDLIEVLTYSKFIDGPVLIHAITKKGKGYRNAENNPDKFHGIGAFNPTTGNLLNETRNLSYSEVFGNKLVQLAKENPKIVAVSAAMIAATGLKKFAKYYPNRIFDAGIAEAHAVTFAAGLAASEYKPVVAIYSTFLQRAYDQILIDVCMQNLPVIFAIDRAGNVGADGETHHGVFDLSYLSHMPNMTIMAPKDGRELEDMMEYALRLDGPSAIRYPRGEVIDNVSELENKIIDGTSERIIEGNDVEIFAVGKMVSICMEACIKLKELGVNAGLYNVRFVKPCDKKSILSAATRVKYIVTVEDNVLEGGFGSIVNRILAEEGMCDIKVLNIGWPDKFIEQGSTPELFEKYGLDSQHISERVCDFLERKA